MRFERYLNEQELNESLKRDVLKAVKKLELDAGIGIDKILRKITGFLKIDNRSMVGIVRTMVVQMMQAGIID
jgi:hypothetical protein